MIDKTPIRLVLADDQTLVRGALAALLGMEDDLEIVGTCGRGDEVVGLVQATDADVCLLDIEMPHLSGLELVGILPPPTPEVIIVTSHRDFAVDAFALRVADYLVKPVDYARFHQAIERAASLRPGPLGPAGAAAPLVPEDGTSPELPDQSRELFVKLNNKLVQLNFDDVLYIEAMSTYSVIVTATQKHIVYATLKALEERLPFAHFQRVHRSYIVNTQRIAAIEDNMLLLGAYEVPVGKSYQEAFFRGLRNL